MKMEEILKRVELVEKTIVWIRKPTKGKSGYALKLTGDPMIRIMRVKELERADGYHTEIESDGKTYRVYDHFEIPSRLAHALRYNVKKLMDMEI